MKQCALIRNSFAGLVMCSLVACSTPDEPAQMQSAEAPAVAAVVTAEDGPEIRGSHLTAGEAVGNVVGTALVLVVCLSYPICF